MRKAMAEAVVGDDVFGDDPTVLELQEKVATLLNKDAGLFVPTGFYLTLTFIDIYHMFTLKNIYFRETNIICMILKEPWEI